MDTFGKPIQTTGTTPNPYRFGAAWGYITDPNGFLQLGARYYWPEVGRFVQQDPERDESSGYSYAGGNPLDQVDPTGRRGVVCRISGKVKKGAKRAAGKVRRFAQNLKRAAVGGFVMLEEEARRRFPSGANADKKQHCFAACMLARSSPFGRRFGQAVAYHAQRGWEALGPGIDSAADNDAADIGAFEGGSGKAEQCPGKNGHPDVQHCDDFCRRQNF